jgi:CRISPR-associated protein Cas2
MFYIVCYDTPSPKRGRKFLKLAREYFFHVQKSVFEGYLEKRDFEEFFFRMKRLVNESEDSVRCYILPDEIYFRTKVLGTPPIVEKKRFLLV